MVFFKKFDKPSVYLFLGVFMLFLGLSIIYEFILIGFLFSLSFAFFALFLALKMTSSK